MMQRFREFKQTYGKKYDTAQEDTIRFLIFQENVEKIDSVQSESFTVGVNQFADLTSAEFKQLYTGYTKKTVRGNNIKHLPTAGLPATVDWRSIVTPVKNQGQCGSCWAFSAVAGVEALYAQANGKTLSFSEQQVVDCSTKNGGCNGGDLPPAFDYIISKGLELETTYPYKARDQKCAYKAASAVFAPKRYYYFLILVTSKSPQRITISWLLPLLNNPPQSVSRLTQLSSNTTPQEFLTAPPVELNLTTVSKSDTPQMLGSSETHGEPHGESRDTSELRRNLERVPVSVVSPSKESTQLFD